MLSVNKKMGMFFLIMILLLGSFLCRSQLFDNTEKEQVAFLTEFYKGYMPLQENHDLYLSQHPFLSKSAKALLLKNENICKTLSRTDDICGYGANGDIYLDAQEKGPDLTLENSEFSVKSSGENLFDVSFSVWPGQGAAYYRGIRFLLVKEDDQWRVDDMFYDPDGKFPIESSMRYQVGEDIVSITQNASDLQETWGLLSEFLKSSESVESLKKFILFPVEYCDSQGICESIKQEDEKINQVLKDLQTKYLNIYKKEDNPSDETINSVVDKNTEGPLAAEEDDDGESEDVVSTPSNNVEVVSKDAFDFKFEKSLWWITKIDMRKSEIK